MTTAQTDPINISQKLAQVADKDVSDRIQTWPRRVFAKLTDLNTVIQAASIRHLDGGR